MVFPWFESFWSQLITYKRRSRIPSGIIFCGQAGIGKAALARCFAQYVLCSKVDDKPCKQCRSCVLFEAGNHPDFWEMVAEEEGGTIKIDQIRQLISDLGKTPAFDGYQVVIINKAEDLNRAAANALLKNLEEPSGRVLMILLSEQIQAVPATIRSRCQIIRCPAPSRLQVKEYIQLHFEPQNAEAMLAMADYSPLKATDNQRLIPLRNQLLIVLRELSQGKRDPSLVAAAYLESCKETISLLITLTLDMIKTHFAADTYLNHDDKMAELKSVGKSKSTLQLYTFLDKLLAAMRAVKTRSNANLQLLMETIFIHWRYHHDAN